MTDTGDIAAAAGRLAGGRCLVVAAGVVLLSPGRLLVQRRPRTAAHGAGMLEFPGGKLEIGEPPVAALRRELREEWGEATEAFAIGTLLAVARHDYPPPGPQVVLLFYRVDGGAWREGWAERVRATSGDPVEVDLTALDPSAFLAADGEFIAHLTQGRLAGLRPGGARGAVLNPAG